MTSWFEQSTFVMLITSFLLTSCEAAAQRNQTVVARFPDISGIDQNSPLLTPDQKAAFGVRALFMNASANKAIYSMDLTKNPDTRVNEQKGAIPIIKNQSSLINVDIDLSPDKVSEDNFIPRLQIRTDNGDVYDIVEARFTTKDGRVLSFAFCGFQDKETKEMKWSTVGFAERKDIEELGDGRYNIKGYAVALQPGKPIDTMIFPVGPLDFGIISFVIGSDGEQPGVSVGDKFHPFSQSVSQIRAEATFPSDENLDGIPPTATRTPVPPTATATATPMPRLTMEDLKSMSGADKLKMAPQAESAPEDVVSSFAAGESAKDIAWSGKSLTFWERVVAYEGTTRSGEKVTLYFDLESGRWAKQYADFDEVSKIPADEVADVMVIGGQLVKNKPAFGEGWHDQTEKTLDGKMVFRDENGYVLAVFDVNSNEWIAPNQADVESPTEVSDLRPAYVEKVSRKFMGAQIDASLITDGSLDPTIRKVTVGEQAYAEFMARSIYGVWANYHPGETLETYMQMIAEVQRGERDPLDIAFPAYANDARDGIPYQNADKSVNSAAQKKYLVIPWYAGETPKEVDGVEVRGVSEFSIALVNGKKVKNITLIADNLYDAGEGETLDKATWYSYQTADYIPKFASKPTQRNRSLATMMAGFKWWLTNYHGQQITGYLSEPPKALIDLLVNGGLSIEPDK